VWRSHIYPDQGQEHKGRMSRHRVASVAAATYEPSETFRALPDFTPFAVIAEKIRSRIMSELAAADLTEQRREHFYSW